MLNVVVQGETGKGTSIREAHVHPLEKADGLHNGLVVLSYPFLETEPSTRFFVNETSGNAMNQNVTFSGTPEGIHDGTDLILWTASAISGTWTFASTTNPQTGTRCIDATATANNDESLYSLSGLYADIMMADFTALTGGIRLENFAVGHEVQVRFRVQGVDVGNFVNLYDFVNTGVLNEYQNFIIPKTDLGLSDQQVDEFVIKTVKTSGQNPNYRLDNIQIEQTGDPLVFQVPVDPSERFHISELVFAYADALAGTFQDGTMPALAYDKILALSSLTNGFNITRIKDNKVLFNATIKTLGEHISAGARADVAWSDGTNTFVILRAVFDRPLILTGKPTDSLTVQINDDMSGLLQFTAAARGGIET